MFESKARTQEGRRRFLSLLLAAVLLAAPALGRQAGSAAGAAARPVAPLTESERGLAARVRVETIKEVTAALSSREMQGRGTGQPGGELAARYIADRFARAGLKPLGAAKDSFFQPIEFRESQLAPETSFKAGDQPLRMRDDFVFIPPFSGEKEAAGRLVFVGYGLQLNAQRRDDLKGIDVRGKVVVLLGGTPSGLDAAAWKKAHGGPRVLRKLIMGGASALVFAGLGTAEQPYPTLADYMTRRQVEPADAERPPPQLPPFVAVSDAGAEKLFAGSGTTYAEARARAERGEFASAELKQSARLKFRRQEARVTASNVVGLLEGSDPKLKAEAVVYTAHYDAFGATADGRFYPGAADNALGVAEMLAAAEALVPAKPRRSVIFLAVTGEEYGLHGSEYWVRNPTWPLAKVAADLNFDGMGTEIHGPLKQLVGFGAEHSELGATLEAVAAATGAQVIPDPMPEEKSFYRSDHYAFVKRGIPGLMLLGTSEADKQTIIARLKAYEREHYHQPTDVVRPEWDWQGPAGVARVGALIGLRLANADAMPAWLHSSPFNRKRGTDEAPPEEP